MTNSRPKGARELCSVKIGNNTIYTEVKEGTQKLLNLTKVNNKLKPTKNGKGRGTGVKGTLSYRLLLAAPTTVGGHANCVSVDLPLSGKCLLRDVYAWAYKQSVLAGIVTPWGISYKWKTPAKRPQKNALQKGLDAAGGLLGDLTGAAGGLIGDIGSAASEVGDFIQGAENAAGTVGGYIQGVEGLAGDVITGAEALGGYIAPLL